MIKDNINKFYLKLGLIAFLLISLHFTIYTMIALSFSLRLQPSFALTFIIELIGLLPWVLGYLILIKFVRTDMNRPYSLAKKVSIHSVIIISLFIVHTLWNRTLSIVFMTTTLDFMSFVRDFIMFLDIRTLMYIGGFFCIKTVEEMRVDEQEQLNLSELQKNLEELKVKSIQRRISPDFIGKILDEIYQISETSTTRARQLIAKFSEILRELIYGHDRQEMTVEEEIRLFKLYVDLLSIRVGHEVVFSEDVTSDAKKEIIISVFTLLPVFEALLTEKKETLLSLKKISFSGKKMEDELILSLEFSEIKTVIFDNYKMNGVLAEINANINAKYGMNSFLLVKSQKERIIFELHKSSHNTSEG